MRDVLFISYYFPPCCGAGAQRAAKFAKYLPSYGYRPHVVTCSIEDIRSASDSTLLRDLSDVSIHRACCGEQRVRGLRRHGLGFAVSLGLRPDPQILWRRNVLPKVMEIASLNQISAIFSAVRPFSSALIASELKRRMNIPWILDINDPWAGSSTEIRPSRLHNRMDARNEARCVHEADAIVSVSPGMLETLRRRYPWAVDKLFMIPNGFDAEDFMNNLPSASPDESRGVRIALTGHLHSVNLEAKNRSIRGLDCSTHSVRYLLEAMKQLIAERPEVRSFLSLDLAGRVAKDNLEYAEQLGIKENVRYHGILSRGEAIQLVRKCDAVYLPLKCERDGSRSTLESDELYDYLAQRKPILACVPEGDVADIVRRARAGSVINPYDVQGLKDKLWDLVQQKQYGPLRTEPDEDFISRYERRRLTAQLAGVMDSLVAQLPEPMQVAV